MSNNEITWSNGQWSDTSAPLIGATDHAFWMATTVFDGARSIQGHTPDLDLHCERLNRSAITLGMEPVMTPQQTVELVHEGLKKLSHSTDYYIKLLYFAPGGFIQPDPATSQLAIHIFESPMPDDSGFSATFSEFLRPDPSMAPTDAKASCLYPNTQRILREASARGFDNAIVLDSKGKIAEFAVANLWIVRDGVVLTPELNGTFLNGITRRRVMQLLRDDGIEVREASLTPQDVLDADEVFSTGNYGKVLHCNRIDDRHYAHGPIETRAHELYMAYTKRN
ncbi:branched-chain amino acid aminotransferase [Alcaligenes faecalis]|uniref:branched-chain amino acid aminotransferase n=1 Tax=Alcaligenes faecalis TaxID=511 RepID=UPI0005AB0727|nr:branched-chain amino acid aminotransferase [Alcaligenes faecalis]ATH98304.1 branched chain amino acid aminotransferase [Alcaligenes faecalis]AYZ91094.1 branched-chain amino acid aminotransferase [Alcaligenes faecalis]MCX5596023.1 branched-chain amino acid aminotransferase [Alcaligenes faecalis]QQC33095.1 branched-chain amino acid aminotransferase [Alcaligenes faecalis]CAJ0890865.1 branched-chain amino acid aminotransferase [Alcaligenes faecalis subsp. faecalis]